MKQEILSEEFRRMQKLAGIITESQLNEDEDINWNQFNPTNWTARLKEIAKEMNYNVDRTDQNNIQRHQLAADDAADRGEREAFVGTFEKDGAEAIIAIFSLSKNEKDQDLNLIQSKVVDIYKDDSDVTMSESHMGKVATVIIKAKQQA